MAMTVPRSSVSVTGLLLLAFVALTNSPRAAGQASGSTAASSIPELRYKLVEWPTPPISAAGRAWRLEFHPGVVGCDHAARHSPGASSWCPSDHGIRQQRKARPLVGRRDVQRRKSRGHSSSALDRGQVALFGGVWTGGMHLVRRAFGAGRSAREHLGRRRARPRRLQAERRGEGDHAARERRASLERAPTHFNLPTDVAFAPNGDLYVTDGYGSARVVKFSRDGKYLLQWGTRGKGPGEFGLPHNVVTDAQGRVYVTDRDNQRIEVFDANGKFLTQWTGTGRDLRALHHERPADLDRRHPARSGRQGAGTIARAGNGGSARSCRHRFRRRLPCATQRRGSEVRQALSTTQRNDPVPLRVSFVAACFALAIAQDRAIQVGFCTSLANLAAAKAAGFD